MNTTQRRVTRLPCVRSGGRNDELDKTEDGLDGLDGEILDSRSGTTPTMNKMEGVEDYASECTSRNSVKPD